MKKDCVLTLGDQKWTFSAPLKFRQLAIIEPAMAAITNMKVTNAPTSSKFYDEMANVILAVVVPVDGTFSRAALDDLPLDVDDLSNAVKTIARAGGMWKDPDVDLRKQAEALASLAAALPPHELAQKIEISLALQYQRGKADGREGEALPAETPPETKAAAP